MVELTPPRQNLRSPVAPQFGHLISIFTITAALEIHFAVGPASLADNVEVVTAWSDFKYRILVIHLNSNRGKDATFWRERSTGF
jgi:hypothetical protein